MHLGAANGDLGVTADQVEQADPHVPGEALIDDFHRGHAPTDDPFLVGEVVLANAAACLAPFFKLLAFAGDALQQGIDFVLGKNLLAHDVTRGVRWGGFATGVTG